MSDSTPAVALGHNILATASDRLRSFVERAERLDEEIAARQADKRAIMAEARGSGFSTKAIGQLIRLRKMDPNDRREQEALLDVYKRALGME